MSTSRRESRALHDKRVYIVYIHKEGVSMKLCLEEMISRMLSDRMWSNTHAHTNTQ